jgi:hypothetical protein
VKRRLWAEYTRFYWHGFPMTFPEYLDLPLSDRWFANLELSDIIEQSNEQGGGSQPKDERR